jgi:broad specificity phosphatase PhoE
MSSPLRRAIQTASFTFGHTIRRPDVQYLLVPLAQEVSAKQCDIGHSRAELQQQLPDLLKEQDIGFDPAKIDFTLVEDGWNSKVGMEFKPFPQLYLYDSFLTPELQSDRYAPDHESVQKRAADLRAWLYQRPEARILLVTHGAFLHYLTEDWTGDDPKRGIQDSSKHQA